MAAGVVPQSSCSLSAEAPERIISTSGAGTEALPLPARAKFIGNASKLSIMRSTCQAPVQVVASVAVGWTRTAAHMVVTPLIRASSICWGQMKWIWASMPPR